MRAALGALAMIAAASAAAAEPIGQVVKGAYYFKKGVLYDVKVLVIDVDRARGRVKVLDTESNHVDWVSAGRLLNRTDSTSRDVDRVVIGLKILDALLKPEPQPAAPSWTPGARHARHANVVASATRGSWIPAPGYGWVDRTRSWRVAWRPGQAHPRRALIAGATEGAWLDARHWEVRDRGADADPRFLATVKPPRDPRAPGTLERLFALDEFDLHVDTVKNEFNVFHSKKVDYDAIKSVLFHPEERWLMVLMKDGRRLDLGDRAHVAFAPHVDAAKDVGIIRTKDGAAVEGRVYPLRRAEGPWDGRAARIRFAIGVEMTPAETFEAGGERYVGGVRVARVIDGFPAQKAGLRKGDVLFQVDDVRLVEPAMLSGYLDHAETSQVLVRYVRDGAVGSALVRARRLE